jgi:hypothetical protein
VMDGATRDEEHLTRTDVGRAALDRPRQYALDPEDRLVVAIVAVPGCDPRAGRNIELECSD